MWKPYRVCKECEIRSNPRDRASGSCDNEFEEVSVQNLQGVILNSFISSRRVEGARYPANMNDFFRSHGTIGGAVPEAPLASIEATLQTLQSVQSTTSESRTIGFVHASSPHICGFRSRENLRSVVGLGHVRAPISLHLSVRRVAVPRRKLKVEGTNVNVL